MTVYAVNGLGRMGKLALNPLLERGAQIAWINDAVGDAEMHAHLLEFDTVHGRWDAEFSSDAESITIDGTRQPYANAVQQLTHHATADTAPAHSPTPATPAFVSVNVVMFASVEILSCSDIFSFATIRSKFLVIVAIPLSKDG